MNVIKIAVVLLTSFGFGFGVDQLLEENEPKQEQYDYQEGFYGYCHRDGYFMEYMLNDLSESDRAIVEEKIDELLLEYEVTLEEVYYDFELRHEFMFELMNFLEENDIDMYYQDEYSGYHRGMGRHRSYNGW